MSQLGRITPRDLSRIDMSVPGDILYWCRELGCNEARLRRAIAAVGTHVADVREEITGHWR